MENRTDGKQKPEQQPGNTAAGEKLGNPFENGKTIDQEVEQAKDKLNKEQEFKEAQTERD